MQPDQNPNTQPAPPLSPLPPLPPPPTPLSTPGQGLSPDYDFIVNPKIPPKKSLRIGSTNPLIARLIIFLVGFLVLIIIFIIVKNLLATKPFITADYLNVLQQQQEIIHILNTDLTGTAQQSQLTLNNQNFVQTTELSIASAQTQLSTYLKANHVKIKSAELNLKISTTTDNDLSSSLQTNNFSQEFNQIMLNELQTYERYLTVAYNTSHGVKGKALLKSEYAGAQLLIKQLDSPSS